MRFLLATLAFAFSAPCALAQDYPTRADKLTSQIQVENFGASLGITDTDGVRPLLSLALDLVKHFESWEPAPYNDAAGYCTIGYGHLIAFSRCEETTLGEFHPSISVERGAALLDEDSIEARLAVQNAVTVDLTDEQFGALSSFVFNLGETKFRRSTLLRLINAGELDLASAQFGRWTYAGGVQLNGLVARRGCEAALFRGDLTYGANGQFDRARCVSLGIAEIGGEPIDIYVGE